MVIIVKVKVRSLTEKYNPFLNVSGKCVAISLFPPIAQDQHIYRDGNEGYLNAVFFSMILRNGQRQLYRRISLINPIAFNNALTLKNILNVSFQ